MKSTINSRHNPQRIPITMYKLIGDVQEQFEVLGCVVGVTVVVVVAVDDVVVEGSGESVVCWMNEEIEKKRGSRGRRERKEERRRVREGRSKRKREVSN